MYVIEELTPIMKIIILSSNRLIKKHFFYHKTILGCSKKTKRGRTGSSQMLNYLSRKHEKQYAGKRKETEPRRKKTPTRREKDGIGRNEMEDDDVLSCQHSK